MTMWNAPSDRDYQDYLHPQSPEYELDELDEQEPPHDSVPHPLVVEVDDIECPF